MGGFQFVCDGNDVVLGVVGGAYEGGELVDQVGGHVVAFDFPDDA